MSAVISGFGRTNAKMCELVDGDVPSLVETVTAEPVRGVCLRGAGSGYGDCAVNGGGTVWRLDTRGLSIDHVHGVVEAEAGATLTDLYTIGVPFGLVPPVTPGTRSVSIGGMLAADVHGKNHHRSGSIANHVASIDVLCGDGEIRRYHPGQEEFRATIGGMGLTGAIVSARVTLERVPGTAVLQTTRRAMDFSGVVDAMHAADAAPFSVAWVDLSSNKGRGVVQSGSWVEATTTEQFESATIQAVQIPNGVLNRWTVAAFNAAWWARAGLLARREMNVGIGAFFHPLDMLGSWNKLYGSHGFLQYQFAVPGPRLDVVERIVADIVDARFGTPMVVLKRFGPGNDHHLSFPIEGWTLAVDLPARSEGLAATVAQWDDLIAEVGGRVYLAKDACTTPEHIERMYPQLDAWRDVRERMDPKGVFCSDLGRRLGLVERVGGR